MNCRSWSPNWTNGNLQITHRMYEQRQSFSFHSLCAYVNWRYCNFGLFDSVGCSFLLCFRSLVCLIACLLRIHIQYIVHLMFAFLFLNTFVAVVIVSLFFRHFYHALYTCLKAHNIPSCNEFCHEILFYRVKWAWYDIITAFFRNRLIQFSRWMSAFWFEHATTAMCM